MLIICGLAIAALPSTTQPKQIASVICSIVVTFLQHGQIEKSIELPLLPLNGGLAIKLMRKKDEPMKTIHGQQGETIIRPIGTYADHAALFLGAYMAFPPAGELLSVLSSTATKYITPDIRLQISFRLMMFLIICARAAWCSFGSTKISVSLDELNVKHYIGNILIRHSYTIKPSTINDVYIKEYQQNFRGMKTHRWILVIHVLSDDYRVAKFNTSHDANEFMEKYVR